MSFLVPASEMGSGSGVAVEPKSVHLEACYASKGRTVWELG